MFEKLTQVNQAWLCDFSYLTRRFAYSGVSNRKYNPNPSTEEWRGQWHKTGSKKNPTFYPKWSRYNFRETEKYGSHRNIAIYDKPILLFAIQDAYSRFIIHAHLRQSSKEFVNMSHTFPRWFELDDCFKEAFEFQKPLKRLGKPFEFLMDGMIHRWYSKKLEGNYFISKAVKEKNHFLLSPLDAFFGRIQNEMRTELTNRNLTNYVDYYNYERPHSALNGKTPADYFFSGNVFW